MNKILKNCAYMLLVAVTWGAGAVLADGDHSRRVRIDRDVNTFAVLPDGVRFPEGITANPANGDIYVGTFDFGPNHNKLLRYDRHGRLLAQLDFGGTPLLGLGFDSERNKVYILNFGTASVQRVPAAFNANTKPEVVATADGAGHALNALEFDSKGNLYVSDSFQGVIFRIENVRDCNTPCAISPFVQDDLLKTTGFPPFGANGLALSETLLFVANTGDDRVLKIDTDSKKVTVFTQSINGADGIVFDRNGLLWVAANQADEVVALNDKGRVVAKLGEFRGINRNGTPDGLLFPASPVIVGNDIFVTNLAIFLTNPDLVGDEPEEDVRRWTISRMKLPHH